MEEEINLKEIVKGIWMRKIIIIVIIIISMIFGILILKKDISFPIETSQKNQTFAKTSFTIVETENYKISDSTANTYQLILESTENMKKIIEKFELDMKPDELAGDIWVRRIENSDVIEIGIVNEDFIEKYIDILNDFLITINTELKNTYSINDIYIVEEPIIMNTNDFENSDKEINNNNNNFKKIIIITLAGTIIGFAIVICLEFIDGSIKNENQIINNLKINNLVSINFKQNKKEIEEKYRKIKLNIKNYKSILITSLSNDNKNNEIVYGIADLYSKYGKKVGLIDITQEKLDIYCINNNEKVNYNKVNENNTSDNFIELLENEKIAEYLEKINTDFDIILINSNNMLQSVNSLTMSKFVDGTICIVEERKTKIKSLEKLIHNLEKIDSRVIGTIITIK